ncbi:MAG: serine/threonine-protein kinase [Planctomycetaceae bacterium]
MRYFGDYELIEEIARGGMGVVYKARQVNLNRIVALKMMLAGQLASEDDVKRFRLEAEAAAHLDHPGIVPIFEIGLHEGQHYFSMGFVDGESLSQRIKRGPLPPKEAAELTRKIAESIAYAHSRNVVHRDLKPANILLDQTGEPKVTDFGLAKRTDSDSGLTQTGVVLGTPSYMPPEQAAGRISEIGPLSDVYSLGSVLYCLLSGRPPFQAPTAVETMRQVMDEEPASLSASDPRIPKDLEAICRKCLQKDPAKRYPSAKDVSDDLGRWQRGEKVTAAANTSFSQRWPWLTATLRRWHLIIAVLIMVELAFYSNLIMDRLGLEPPRNYGRIISSWWLGILFLLFCSCSWLTVFLIRLLPRIGCPPGSANPIFASIHRLARKQPFIFFGLSSIPVLLAWSFLTLYLASQWEAYRTNNKGQESRQSALDQPPPDHRDPPAVLSQGATVRSTGKPQPFYITFILRGDIAGRFIATVDNATQTGERGDVLQFGPLSTGLHEVEWNDTGKHSGSERIKLDDKGMVEGQPKVYQFGGREITSYEEVFSEVVRRMPSPYGAVHLQTADTSPIAFVFDWSGSMKENLGNSGVTRAKEALAAMSKLISLQDAFCPGSLRVFGHRRGITALNPKFAPHFQAFQFPNESNETPDDPQKDSQQLVSLTLLNGDGQKAFDDVLKRLDKSQPFGATPLLYSLCRGITQDLQYKPGMVVAITDGAATDPENTSELIHLLKDSNGKIQILVIMFDINAADTEAITQLFGQEGLRQWCTVKSATDRNGIIQALNDFRRPPVLKLENPPLEPIHIEALKDRNHFQYEDEELPVGISYQLVYKDLKTKDNIPLEFSAGDTQRLQVDWPNNEFLFIRSPSIASSEFRSASTEDRQTPTQLSAISTAKRNGADSSLEIDLMLTGDDSSLPVKTPEEVEFWFEADSAPGQQFHRSEERLLRDSSGLLIGAPAWKVRLQDWPRSHVRVNAVCRMTRTRPDHVFKWSEIAEHNGPDKFLHHPASRELPNADLWYRKLPDKLQIRLDVPDGSPESAKELPDVRIEIGKRDATNGEFYPDRVNSVCRRFESGSVVWEFEGDWTDDKLAEREIALTSRSSRQNGALVLKQPLLVPVEMN